MDLASELRAVVRGDVDASLETLAANSRDASIFEVRPEVVVYPRDAHDVSAIVQFVNTHPEWRLSITARAGGTCMSGGPLGESIILNFGRYMNRIEGVDPARQTASAEPGVYYRDFDMLTRAHNLMLPSYPASREICMLGGMVANNAGGEKSLTYGKTDRYVSRLQTVLADGKEYTFEPLSRVELEKKMAQNDFEGAIYKNLHTILEKNYDAVVAARPKVSKNSAGYALWDVWDQKTFDLTKLFVGSQGTLGIITQTTFRLVKPALHSGLFVLFLPDLHSLAGIVNAILACKPESFESYDDYTLRFAIRYMRDLMHFMKAKNFFRLAVRFIPEALSFLSGGLPKLVLLAEFTGATEAEVREKMNRAEEAGLAFGVRMRRAGGAADAEKYWTIRRESFNLLRHHVRGLHTAPFIDDMVVAPDRLPQFLPELEIMLKQYNLIFTVAGHIGNGNFHIIPLMDFKKPETEKIIFELGEKVYTLVLKYGGSITGEHNDGIIRTPFLPRMYGDVICQLFEEVKRIFDPHNIFNPGKKTGGTVDYARAHLIRE